MKPLILALVLLFGFPFSQDKPLTNADVLQMSQVGLSPETIVAKIRASNNSFDTSPSALAELKSKGVADTVLTAMIGTPAGNSAARETAIKALRRLANAVEVGVSYIEYGTLVAEAKTELETALINEPDSAFKRSAFRAMQEYQFAASVWQVYWRSDDTISGTLRDTAVTQYGVKTHGFLKLVWRTEFLSAIWREARRHYESALSPTGQVEVTGTPAQRLAGSWHLRLEGRPESPPWYLIVYNNGGSLGEIRIGSSSYRLQRIALSEDRFLIATKPKDSTELTISASVDGQVMRGSISGVLKKENINCQLTGDRGP